MSHMLFKQHTNIRSRKKIQKTFKKWFVFYIESTFDRVCFLKTTDCCISIDLMIALSLVHTVPDFSPGVATVWTPGPTGTTP